MSTIKTEALAAYKKNLKHQKIARESNGLLLSNVEAPTFWWPGELGCGDPVQWSHLSSSLSHVD
jgi:hypothetical protein